MKMQMIQFVSIVNLIQMKSMKVIHNKRNMMIQEFQHCMEFQLIEEMNMKMQRSQFVSIVNWIPDHAGPARLTFFHSGTGASEWFLLEVIDGFHVPIEFRGGVSFIICTNKKSIDRCFVWDQALLKGVVSVLKYKRNWV
jgi:hypothetical protein